MENTRRSFLKKVSAAGIGAAGLAMAGNAGATTTAAEPQKKKTAGKDDGKLRFGFTERVLDAMSILIMYWRSPVIRS